MSGTVTLQQGGDALALAVNNSYRISRKWWKPDRGGADIVNRGRKNNAGTEYDVLTITPKGGTPFDVWFDAETHFLVRMIEKQGPATIIATMSDYRSVDGVMLPTKIVHDAGNRPEISSDYDADQSRVSGTHSPILIYAAQSDCDGLLDRRRRGANHVRHPDRQQSHLWRSESGRQRPVPLHFRYRRARYRHAADCQSAWSQNRRILPGTGPAKACGRRVHAYRSLEVGDASVKNQLFIVFPLDKFRTSKAFRCREWSAMRVFRSLHDADRLRRQKAHPDRPQAFQPVGRGHAGQFLFNDHIPEVMGTFEGLPAKFDIDTGRARN